MIIDVKNVLINVHVPQKYTQKISDAIFEIGAGNIGDYSNCSNIVKSIGTFKPNNHAKPFIGEKCKFEKVKEDRLEILCDIDKVKEVVEVIRKNHPYEEPGIFITPIIDEKDIK